MCDRDSRASAITGYGHNQIMGEKSMTKYTVGVVLSEDQYAHAFAEATKNNMSLSQWIRRQAFGAGADSDMKKPGRRATVSKLETRGQTVCRECQGAGVVPKKK